VTATLPDRTAAITERPVLPRRRSARATALFVVLGVALAVLTVYAGGGGRAAR
jgi:iron complex transport system permease protein